MLYLVTESVCGGTFGSAGGMDVGLCASDRSVITTLLSLYTCKDYLHVKNACRATCLIRHNGINIATTCPRMPKCASSWHVG